MSMLATPLLPERVAGIFADPVSFSGGRGPIKKGVSLDVQALKSFVLQGG